MTTASTAPIDVVLPRLTLVKASGKRAWIARCPAHEDRTPSLSITEGRDGRVLLNCHAGCAAAAVVAAIGLTMSDLFPPSANGAAYSASEEAPLKRTTTFVKSYDYVDADAKLLYQVCRFVDEQGKKTFRQRRPDDRGGWIWQLGETPLVLYRLPETIDAIEHGRPIFIVEGEKDADTLAELGYAATTSARGAGKWSEQYSATLTGAHVVILPDNDDPGRSHAEQVAASCTAAGAASVKVVALEGLPPKGDVSDWLPGHSVDEFDAAIAGALPWIPPHLRQENRTRWRLDELLENESIMRPPPPIVPRLAWAGRSTLLAAREKVGKSTLTGYVTACVSRGRPFLGEPTARGDVLIIGLEEFIGDTARRLRHFDADATRVYLVDRFAGEPALRPKELRDHIEAVRPVLVIIDSLTAYGHGQIQDDNNASQMARVVQPLSDVVHQLGVALILIHHATKATGRSRGSTAITAGVDVVVEFEAPEKLADTDPTLRVVRSVGRVPVPRLYQIRFDETHYTVVDSGSELPLDQRIIAFVRDHPPSSVRDVRESVRGNFSTIESVITQLLTDGRLLDIGRGRYKKLVVPEQGAEQRPFGYGAGE